jgi:hypothetical protein
LVEWMKHGDNDARLRLADLLEQHPLTRNPGEQAIAAYARSRVDDVLDRAVGTAHMYIEERRMPKMRALEKVSKEMPEVVPEFWEEFYAILSATYENKQRLYRRRKKKNQPLE